MSDSTIRNYIDRDSKPGYEVLEKLYHSFKRINLPWLFGEAGEPLLSDSPTLAQETNATYAPSKNFSPSQVIKGKGNIQQQTAASTQALEREIDALKRELALANALVASKDETIGLLKAQATNHK